MPLKPSKAQIFKTQNTDTYVNNTIVDESGKSMMGREKELVVSDQPYKYKLHVKDKKCSLCEKIFCDHYTLKRHLNTSHKLIRENIDPLTSKGEWSTWIKNVNSTPIGRKSSSSLNPRNRSKTLATDSMLKQINKNWSQSKDRSITAPTKLNPRSKSQNKQTYHRQPTKNMLPSLFPLIEHSANHNDLTIENGIDFYNHTTDQSNEVQAVQMLNGVKHFSVNGWPNETQEVLVQNDKTLTMYNADTLNMNTLTTQPLIDQPGVYDLPNEHKQTDLLHLCDECGFHFPSGKMLLEHKQYCFIHNYKQELSGEKNFTQVPMVENVFFDLPSVEQKPPKLHQNYNEMQSTIDMYNKINQSDEIQIFPAYKNKTQLTLSTINDEFNNIEIPQTYCNDTQISADTNFVFSHSTESEIAQMYYNEADVFMKGCLNETQENLVQSHQALTLYNTQMLDTNTIKVHSSMDEYKMTGEQSVHKQNHFSYLCNICGALFKNKKKLVKHSQEIHSAKQSQKNSQVQSDKCVLLGSSSLEKILLANYNETEVNKNTYSKPSQLNEVQIFQTYNNKTQLGVKSNTESVESNQIQTLQTYGNETQMNADTISVLSQSVGAQTIQMNADKTRVSMNVGLNKTPEVQTQSDQLMTLYNAEEFNKILFETHSSIGQNIVSDWSSMQNQNNLSYDKTQDETQISVDINNWSCQPYKAQTIQKQNNKAPVYTNGWPTKAQEIKVQSKPIIYKNQTLNFNSVKIQSSVDKSVKTNRSSSERKKISHMCYVCGDQFRYKQMLLKHKQEIHNHKLKVFVKKVDQVTADQNMLIDCPIIMRETHTNHNPIQSNINKYDTTSQSSETLTLQTCNNEIQSVANCLDVSDQSGEIKTLNPYNKKTFNVDATMPFQLNETPAIQIRYNKKHVNLKSLPNESKVVQVLNDHLKIQSKVQSLDTNTSKIQNFIDKSKVSCRSTKPCSKKIDKQPSILFESQKHKCTICQKILLNSDNLKQHMKIVHELGKNKKQQCPICGKMLCNKGSLKKHVTTIHNTELNKPKTTRICQKQKCAICKKILADKFCLKNHVNRYHNVEAKEERTKHDGTRTITEKRKFFHNSNNVLQAQRIEPYTTKNMSDQPHKMLSNSDDTCSTVFSQPNKIQESSNRTQGSETALSTKTKVVRVHSNHINTFKTQSSVESGCQSVHDLENVSWLCPYCGIQFKNKNNFLKHNQEAHTPKLTIIGNRNSQVSTNKNLKIDSPSNVEVFHTNFNEKPVSVDTVNLSDQLNKVQIPQTCSNETQVHTDMSTLSSQPTIPKSIQFYSNSPISEPICTNTSEVFNSVDEPIESGNNKKVILQHKQEIHNTKLKLFVKKVDQVSEDQNMLLDCPSIMQETHTNCNQTKSIINKYDTSQSSETLTHSNSFANFFEMFHQAGKIKTLHPHYNKTSNVDDKTSVPFQHNETQVIQIRDDKKHVNLKSFPNESQKIQVQNDHLKIQHKVQSLDTNTLKTQSSADKSIVYSGSKKPGIKSVRQECTICGKTLLNSITLKRHMQNVHRLGADVKQKCTICEKTCNNEGLHKHMKNVHRLGGGIKQECTICKKLLCNYSSLRRHTKTIHGVEMDKKRTRHKSSDQSNKVQIPLTCSSDIQFCTDTTTTLSSQPTITKSIQFHCNSPISESIGTSTSEIYNTVDKPVKSDQLSRSSSKQKKLSNLCQFCGVKFKNEEMLSKHNQELHSTVHKVLENKVEQVPADQYAVLDLPSIMQNSVSNYKETQSNVDMYDATSHSRKPQILEIDDNETQLVTNMFDVSNQSSEIETLQAYNQGTQINAGTTNVPSQSDKAQVVQIHKNKKQAYLNSWPNDTQKIQNQKAPIVHHEAQVFGIKTLKTQASVDKSEVSSQLRKPCNDQNNISLGCNDCKIQFNYKTCLLKHECNRQKVHDSFEKKLDQNNTLQRLKRIIKDKLNVLHSQSIDKSNKSENSPSTTFPDKQWTKNNDPHNTVQIKTCSVKRNKTLEVNNIDSYVTNYHSNKIMSDSKSSPKLCQPNKTQTTKRCYNETRTFVTTRAKKTKKIQTPSNDAKSKNFTCDKPKAIHILPVNDNKMLSTEDIHIVSSSLKTKKPPKTYGRNILQVPENCYQNYQFKIVQTASNDYQVSTDEFSVDDSPNNAQIIRTRNNKTYSTFDTFANAHQLKKEKILESVSIDTALNQSNNVQSSINKMQVPSNTYTMSDLPKETRRLQVYENKTSVATEECSVPYSPINKEILQTLNNKTESEPQIDIIPGQSFKIEISSPNNDETQNTCLPHNFDQPAQISNEKSQNRDRGKTCPVCKKMFLKADDCKLHLVTHNAYKCDKCVLTFNSQLKLDVHRINHESDGLFICDYVCCTGLTFVCKKSLFKHLESHKRLGRPKKY